MQHLKKVFFKKENLSIMLKLTFPIAINHLKKILNKSNSIYKNFYYLQQQKGKIKKLTGDVIKIGRKNRGTTKNLPRENKTLDRIEFS